MADIVEQAAAPEAPAVEAPVSSGESAAPEQPAERKLPESVPYDRYQATTRRYRETQAELAKAHAELSSLRSKPDAPAVTPEQATAKQIAELQEFRQEYQQHQLQSTIKGETEAACKQFTNVEPNDVYRFIASVPVGQEVPDSFVIAQHLSEQYAARFAPKSELEKLQARIKELEGTSAPTTAAQVPTEQPRQRGRFAPAMPPVPKTSSGTKPDGSAAAKTYDLSTREGRLASAKARAGL